MMGFYVTMQEREEDGICTEVTIPSTLHSALGYGSYH